MAVTAGFSTACIVLNKTLGLQEFLEIMLEKCFALTAFT